MVFSLRRPPVSRARYLHRLYARRSMYPAKAACQPKRATCSRPSSVLSKWRSVWAHCGKFSSQRAGDRIERVSPPMAHTSSWLLHDRGGGICFACFSAAPAVFFISGVRPDPFVGHQQPQCGEICREEFQLKAFLTDEPINSPRHLAGKISRTTRIWSGHLSRQPWSPMSTVTQSGHGDHSGGGEPL